MPRINPTVTHEAEKIYNDLPHHERGRFVSSAIIEKHERSTGTDLHDRVQRLEAEIAEIKRRMEGGE